MSCPAEESSSRAISRTIAFTLNPGLHSRVTGGFCPSRISSDSISFGSRLGLTARDPILPRFSESASEPFIVSSGTHEVLCAGATTRATGAIRIHSSLNLMGRQDLDRACESVPGRTGPRQSVPWGLTAGPVSRHRATGRGQSKGCVLRTRKVAREVPSPTERMNTASPLAVLVSPAHGVPDFRGFVFDGLGWPRGRRLRRSRRTGRSLV